MHILTKKFKFYKFQKSDLILSEIGCTVINVYIHFQIQSSISPEF